MSEESLSINEEENDDAQVVEDQIEVIKAEKKAIQELQVVDENIEDLLVDVKKVDKEKIEEGGEETKLEVIPEEDEHVEGEEEKSIEVEEAAEYVEGAITGTTTAIGEEYEGTEQNLGKIYTEEEEEFDYEGDEQDKLNYLPKHYEIFNDDDDDLMFQFSSPDISYEEYEEEQIEEEEVEVPIEMKLDRYKLIEYYKQMIIEKAEATRLNDLLNQQAYEYFNNKNIFRASLEDNPAQVFELMTKYRSCLLELDRLIPRKNKITQDCSDLIAALKNEEMFMRSENDSNLSNLNTRLRETGITFQSSKSGQFLSDKAVERLIRRMTVLRKIIQEERFNFIKTQAKMVEVEKKSKELEDLGNGLMMCDYEQLRTETQSLSEKIEECDNELTKLRIRCYSDTQILAHIREKEYMLSNTIQLQIEVNKELLNDLVSARMDVNEKKLNLDNLRKKYKKMRENCGLLDKPLLLRDFDATMDKIDNLKVMIQELRDNNDSIKLQQDNILMEMDAMAFIPTESQMFDEALNAEMSLMDKEVYPRVLQGIPKVRSFFKKEWESKLK